MKGFRLEVNLKKSIKLIVTDGFDLEFSFELESFDKDYMKRFKLLKASMRRLIFGNFSVQLLRDGGQSKGCLHTGRRSQGRLLCPQ